MASNRRPGCGTWLAIAFAVTVAGCASDPGRTPLPVAGAGDRSQGFLAMGDRAAAAGELTTAAAFYEQAAGPLGDDVVALGRLGDVFLEAGRWNDAADVYGRLLRIDGSQLGARRGYAKALIAMGQPASAGAHLEAVLAAVPDDRQALNLQGVINDMMGQSEAAAASYRRALELAPGDHRYTSNLGLSRALAGDYDTAIALLEPLASQPGSTPRVRQNLAVAYALSGDLAAARRTSLLDLDPATVERNISFVVALRGSADPADAAKALLSSSVSPADETRMARAARPDRPVPDGSAPRQLVPDRTAAPAPPAAMPAGPATTPSATMARPSATPPADRFGPGDAADRAAAPTAAAPTAAAPATVSMAAGAPSDGGPDAGKATDIDQRLPAGATAPQALTPFTGRAAPAMFPAARSPAGQAAAPAAAGLPPPAQPPAAAPAGTAASAAGQPADEPPAALLDLPEAAPIGDPQAAVEAAAAASYAPAAPAEADADEPSPVAAGGEADAGGSVLLVAAGDAADAEIEPPAQAAAPATAWLVSLGTHSDAAAALAEWRSLRARHPDLLGGLTRLSQPGDGAQALLAGPLAGEAAAEALCRDLEARGVSCMRQPI